MYFPKLDPLKYNFTVKKLRKFFDDRSFIEVFVEPGKILAACEDPATIVSANLGGVDYPLKQTGQMGLEEIIIANQKKFKEKGIKGIYCITYSYRNEPKPIKGRHYYEFPMFEFEFFGDFSELLLIETELIKFFGFKEPKIITYETAKKLFNTDILSTENELELCKDNPVLLIEFPLETNPFWNMKMKDDNIHSLKCDVLLPGIGETIGSAEREVDIDSMRNRFYTIEDGKYKDLLFSKFTQQRVEKELLEYLTLFENTPKEQLIRSGAGLGITRLYSAIN